MPKRRKKYIVTPETIETRANRMREVRDIYNKLRVKYRAHEVDKFFKQNYFMQPDSIHSVLQRVDRQQVDITKASIIYTTVMSDNFHL